MATNTQHNKDANEAKLTLSRDPEKAIEQVIETIENLREIYVKENEALAQSDTKRFLSLQDQKIQAAKLYQKNTAQLLERKEEIEKLPRAVKEKLMRKQENFAAIMADNLQAIDKLQRSVKRLNERIMHSAREAAQTENINYSAKGMLSKNQRPVSIGLSEQI